MPDEVPEDREESPQTQAYTPLFDDTGENPQPEEAAQPEEPDAEATGEPEAETSPPEVAHAPARPVAVPGQYYSLKWWRLALLIAAVWLVAAAAGLALFYWWYHALDKTPAVFVVLVYVVVSTVAGLMLAMVQDRPVVSALAIAVMSAPFASVAAAAPLYGFYYCERTAHCLVGIIPY